MKLIFLDFDGVLNHQQWYTSEDYKKVNLNGLSGDEWELTEFCPWSVGLLNQLVDDTGAKVVVSSSWRKGRTEEDLMRLLDDVGFTGEVIGKTPYFWFGASQKIEYSKSVPRGCEIDAWLELNEQEDAKYIILDDDSDMLYWQRENYFRVDEYCGLTSNVVYRATQFLNR